MRDEAFCKSEQKDRTSLLHSPAKSHRCLVGGHPGPSPRARTMETDGEPSSGWGPSGEPSRLDCLRRKIAVAMATDRARTKEERAEQGAARRRDLV